MADDIDAFNPFDDENTDAADEENTARAVLPDVSLHKNYFLIENMFDVGLRGIKRTNFTESSLVF